MSEESENTGEVEVEAAVPPTNESNQAQEGQADGGMVQEGQNVPLTALQSVRAEKQELRDELRMMKDHLALIQANQNASAAKPKDEFEGVEDGDVMTFGEYKKHIGKLAGQFSMTIEELKMTQRYPDYQEVITKYLPEVIKTNPGLARTLEKTKDYELAYYLAKNSDPYRTENKRVKKSADAQRIVANSQKAGTLSSMGSTSPISQAKRYKDMSDDDFRSLMDRNIGAL